MRKIIFCLSISALAAFTSCPALGQDAATQQQIDQMNGRIQDLYGVLDKQTKHLDALEKSLGELKDKLDQPAMNSNASADDLKKLATQVKDLAKKQQDDNDLIVKELEKLGKSGGAATSHKPPVVSTDNASSSTNGPQNGYYYEIKNGDTLSAIAKAYSAELKIKLTPEQIQAANPGLNPKNLIVGKKIFIPKPQ